MTDIPEQLTRYRGALVRAIDRKATRRRRSNWVFAVGATAAVVAGVALGITTPWHAGPSVLDQAAAAISAPGPGQILEERTVNQLHTRVNARGPFHTDIWIDGAPPHRWRATYERPLLDATPPAEYGGMLGRAGGLSYSATDKVLDPANLQPIRQSELDPAAFIRDAITAGRAKVEGTTTVRGRRVRQILITSKVSNAPVARYWVDAGTYRPVRVALLAGVTDPYKVGFPVLSVALIAYGYSMGFGPVNGPYAVVSDFAVYRYLPRTPANRKLADIRAMHPGVPIV